METAIKGRIEELEGKVNSLGTDVLMIKSLLGAELDKKDAKAWNRLEEIGKEISQNWHSKKTSWQIISEGRR
ncbi:MAG: hypothetical protein KAU14_03955 [Thermoplasmata archaeon]|nr:hypothetical protein [Thermoplasmata archaeon]